MRRDGQRVDGAREMKKCGRPGISWRHVGAMGMAGLASLAASCTRVRDTPSTRDQISLNGTWDFYPTNGSTRCDIKVPAYWDEFVSNGHPASWTNLMHAVYRKSFILPSRMADKEIFLNIGALSTLGKVYFNGVPVGGENTGHYLMAMLPYRMNVTPYAQIGGTNRLEVHVYSRDAFPEDARNRDNGRYLYPFGVEYLVGRRGICGDVSLTACPRVYIDDVQIITDLKKNADPSDDTIGLNVTLVNASRTAQTVTLRNAARPVDGRGAKTFDDQRVTLDAGATQQVSLREVSWPDARYWWPTDPLLYQLTTSLTQGSKTVDAVTHRFGFRQFYAKSGTNYFELNGVRCNLRGDNIDNMDANKRWGDANGSAIAYARMELDEWKAININVFRNHCASYFNEEIFDHCDEIGMMCIDEPPFWQSYQQNMDDSAKALHHMEEYCKQWVRSRRNHPSIIMYSASNEEEQSPLSFFTARREAILSCDRTRPIENDGSQKDPADAEINYHYTSADGSWDPTDPIKRANLYSFFPDSGTTRPRGEGECMWACADGQYPKMDEAGRIAGQCELDGTSPDAVSYAVWARQCARALRGARYQGIADYRTFMNVYHAFDWMEGPLVPAWKDWSAPGLKPVVMINKTFNPYDPNFPTAIRGDAYGYYKNSYAPVAAFDMACDADMLIGATPPVFVGGTNVTRNVVAYNDDFNGGHSLTVSWSASYREVEGPDTPFASGTFPMEINYGEKGTHEVRFTLPENVAGHKILDFTLKVTKNGVQRFQETNPLGYLNGVPPPRLFVSNSSIYLGPLRPQTGLLHKIKLINVGGGASEMWTASGHASWLKLHWTSGNLRREQEIFYTVDTTGMDPSKMYETTVTFTGAHGSTAQATVHVNACDPAAPILLR